ncbi:MAG: SDR family oxidoreductase [Betaproteobacteria bacterium]|nr:SDR family oxidoreductase [Betaproteobacteria bacterium]
MDRIAIVTGAGSGIGKAATLALLKGGYKVALAGRRQDALEKTAQESGAVANALCVPTDVSKQDSVRALFAAVKQKWGRVDVLFNNAGVNAPGASLEEIALDKWQYVVDINLTGMFLCMQEAFRVMKDQSPRGGRIINNGSISAHAPRPGSAPYTATKHAVSGLTRSGALDGRKYDIAVGQIDIGNARTEMAERMAKGVPQADGSIKVEPLMDVAHVGQAVLHMANFPIETNVLFLTIKATKMPFEGRG